MLNTCAMKQYRNNSVEAIRIQLLSKSIFLTLKQKDVFT